MQTQTAQTVKSKSPAKQEAEATKRNILDIAVKEFARKGYNGSRVDEIAALTDTSKRMIYYYFKDKEGLFIAALEEAYKLLRAMEQNIDLSGLNPVEAFAALTRHTFDIHQLNEPFVRLVMVENILYGAHLKRSAVIQKLNAGIIERTNELYQNGVTSGDFRAGLEAVEIHLMTSALCFYNVSNRSSFSIIFKHDMTSKEGVAKRREIVVEAVMRYIKK